MDQLINEPQNSEHQARFDFVKDLLGEAVGSHLFKKTKKMDKEALVWRNETVCCICWDAEYQPVYLLPCPCLATLYHLECLHSWWNAQNLEPTCPTCRAAVITLVHHDWVTTNLAEKHATKKLRNRLRQEKLLQEKKRQNLIQKLDSLKFNKFKDTRPLPPATTPPAQPLHIAPPVQPDARLEPVRAEMPLRGRGRGRGRGRALRGSARPRPRQVRRRASTPEIIDISSDDEAPPGCIHQGEVGVDLADLNRLGKVPQPLRL
ncbi:hypothetical protein BDZ89DRAFT_1040035 [Hymenopellis radicata]|nr:hypothetical protein BDZ89DRAFT_1040035 [Hymenopellis radicata]